MAKFIRLHDIRRNGEVVLNIDAIEYMVRNAIGTEIVSTTHHTKYIVMESMNDILSKLDDLGMVISLEEKKPDDA